MAAVRSEINPACFADHFKLLFLLGTRCCWQTVRSALKTTTPLHQAAKSIYLIPPIFGSQNTEWAQWRPYSKFESI